MKKLVLKVLTIFAVIMIAISLNNVSKAAEISDVEKGKILEVLKENNELSYYNYDKVENIYLTVDLIMNAKLSKVTDEQRKNSEIYAMVQDLDEGVVTTRDNLNEYLNSTIGITVDKLKNYEEFLNATTTKDDKNSFYYCLITGKTNYSDYQITNAEETSNGTIKVTISAKANNDVFSNIIEVVKKGDTYNFVSSVSNDGKDRNTSKYASEGFNNKENSLKKLKDEILNFLKENNELSYYNYDKVENIYLTVDLIMNAKLNRVTDEQRKNSEIYAMVQDLDEGVLTTRDDLNEYLKSTIGITVDKLKNYDKFLNATTTKDNKNNFYYIAITGPTLYSDYEITKFEVINDGKYGVTVTAKANDKEFTNYIVIEKSNDTYRFISSTSADKNNRTLSDSDENIFNNKKITDTQNKEDNTVANTKIPQTGVVGNVIISSVIVVIGLLAIVVFVKYKKLKEIK